MNTIMACCRKQNKIFETFWAILRICPSNHAGVKTVKEHRDGILSRFDNRLTTGFLEGINRLIQSDKSCARGCCNPQNMTTMGYLIAGKPALTGTINPHEMTKSLIKAHISLLESMR